MPIPKEDDKFNAYMVKYKSKFAARGGPFICVEVDNNGVHAEGRLFPPKDFTFKIEPSQDATKK